MMTDFIHALFALDLAQLVNVYGNWIFAILFFGGETLHYFALALAIGIVFGIYSSALVMAALVMWLGVSRENLVKPEKKTNQDKVMT